MTLWSILLHILSPGQRASPQRPEQKFHFQSIFFKTKCLYCDINSPEIKFVSEALLDSKSTLVQVMAWRLTGDKPLPEPMLTMMYDDIYRNHATMSEVLKWWDDVLVWHVLSQNCYDTYNRNPSTATTRTGLSCIFNIILTNDRTMPGNEA